ncbi:mitochondrial ATPase inhibitor, IATP-domain-containing protein [Aspergillus taichungensis]|uniref:ATPase inhibitor, mitochondrial n=1 Tax=Aspergillus taichungensis TaxID=482145 RepID=A0A2J5I8U7_9EURO|nr:mitochondrial ATPase inhibitor, IATP-domain-containing protein [Aspergillus taichungensis]
MLRQVSRPLSTASRSIRLSSRSFSAVAPKMTNDTSGPAPTANRDSFGRREAAEEAVYIRQHELEKLRKLKESVSEQRKHLDKLDEHIDTMTKEQNEKK